MDFVETYLPGKAKKCKTYAFWGNDAGMYTRFAAAIFSSEQKKRVLILDAAKNRSLFISATGRTDCSTVSLRFADYTTDIGYAMEHMYKYDYFVIRDDFSDERGSYDQYRMVVDVAYMCLGADKYSLEVFLRANNCFDRYSEIPYFYIFSGTEESADEWRVKEYWRYAQQRKCGPQKIYYIPSDPKDFNGFLNLEYGALCMKSLSSALKGLLKDVMKSAGMNDDVMGRVEARTMFCL